jgi:hypothetical protein
MGCWWTHETDASSIEPPTSLRLIYGKRNFSEINLARAYYQIPTPFELFKAVNTMFGLRNAGQTCQRFVDEITRSLDFVYAHINDFLIASEDKQRHRECLRTLFERLNDYD